MASLIEAWKRMIDMPEKTNSSLRSDRRVNSGDRGNYAQRKASAARAVERLVEQEETVHLSVPSSVYRKEDSLKHQECIGDTEEGKRDRKGNIKLQATTVKEVPVLTSEEIKRIVEEALNEAKDTEEIKEYLAQRFSMIESHIISVRNMQKQEMIAVAVREVREKVDLISLDSRKMGSMRIMLGISIGFHLITLAIFVAYVLNFIRF